MADQTAATATASATNAESASGNPSASNGVKAATASELTSAASFDVEEYLAAQEATGAATETNPNAEGETNTTTGETEEGQQAPDEYPAANDEAAIQARAEELADKAANPEGKDKEDDDSLEGLKPKAIKRFDKLLKQRDEALAEARAHKAELDALKAKSEARQDEPTPVKDQSNPLLSITNEEQLEATEHFWNQVRSWCRRNPAGGTPPKEMTGGREVEFDADAVVDNLEKAEALLEAVPKRRDQLSSFRTERAKVREANPALFQAGTPENAAARAWFPRLLNFRAQADQDAILARLVKAETQEREERDGVARYVRVPLKKPDSTASAATATQSEKPKPKPAPPAAIVPPVRATNGKSAFENAMAKVNAPNGSVDVEELLEAAGG